MSTSSYTWSLEGIEALNLPECNWQCGYEDSNDAHDIYIKIDGSINELPNSSVWKEVLKTPSYYDEIFGVWNGISKNINIHVLGASETAPNGAYMFEKCYLGFERETGKFRSISFSVPQTSPDSEHTLTQDDALKMATAIASQYVEIDSCTIEASDHLFVFTDYGGYKDFSAFAFAFTNQNTNSRIEIRITKEGYLSTVEISED